MGLERPIILSGSGKKKEEPLVKITGGDFEPERISGRAEARTESPDRKKEKAKTEKKENEKPKMGGGGLEQPIVLTAVEHDKRNEPLIKITGGDFEPEKVATHAGPYTESLNPKRTVEQSPDGELRTALDKAEEAYDSLMRGRNVLKPGGKLRGTKDIAMETAERLVKKDKEKEDIPDYTELSEHRPGLPGQDDLETQREALGPEPLRPASLSRYGNLPAFERPSQRKVPTPEEQEQKKAELAKLREALVRIEQDEYAKVAGADTGAYYEAHQKALKEYDRARAEFIGDDISRYSQEQFELMKKRGEGTPGKFGKWVENTDKFWRKHPIWKAGISGALLGLGAFFAPALGVRSAFMGGAAFAGSHEKMRRLSRDGGMFGLIEGINKQSLKDLESLKPEDLEERMAALAAYAKVQGYWDDVEGPYKKLQEAHLGKLRTKEGLDVNKYASEQINKSRDAFDERLWKEDLKRQGRVAGAVGIGALAGGLLKWLWGAPPAPPTSTPVPAPTGGSPLPPPGRVPVPTDAAPWVGTDVPPAEVNSAPWAGADVPPAEVNSAPWAGADVPPPSEVLQTVLEYIPAEHGLRPEYYDLIKDKSAADFLGRGRFATSFDRQYPWPKVDGEYPWVTQKSISEIRVGPYVRLQERMHKVLAALPADQAEEAKKLPVSEFLKKIMGARLEKTSSAPTP